MRIVIPAMLFIVSLVGFAALPQARSADDEAAKQPEQGLFLLYQRDCAIGRIRNNDQMDTWLLTGTMDDGKHWQEYPLNAAGAVVKPELVMMERTGAVHVYADCYEVNSLSSPHKRKRLEWDPQKREWKTIEAWEKEFPGSFIYSPEAPNIACSLAIKQEQVGDGGMDAAVALDSERVRITEDCGQTWRALGDSDEDAKRREWLGANWNTMPRKAASALAEGLLGWLKSEGLDRKALASVVRHPLQQEDCYALCAAAEGARVAQSYDGGKTWQWISHAKNQDDGANWVNGGKFAVLASLSATFFVYAVNDDCWISVNGGKTWAHAKPYEAAMDIDVVLAKAAAKEGKAAPVEPRRVALRAILAPGCASGVSLVVD